MSCHQLNHIQKQTGYHLSSKIRYLLYLFISAELNHYFPDLIQGSWRTLAKPSALFYISPPSPHCPPPHLVPNCHNFIFFQILLCILSFQCYLYNHSLEPHYLIISPSFLIGPSPPTTHSIWNLYTSLKCLPSHTNTLQTPTNTFLMARLSHNWAFGYNHI